jgi:hypothetical protein
LDRDDLNLQLGFGGGNWWEGQETGRRFPCPRGLLKYCR